MVRTSPSIDRFAFAALAILLGGCTKPSDPVANPAPSRPAILRLLVVDDPAMAKQIVRVKGEWKARSGGELEVREMTAAELTAAKALAADAVIYPAAELGSLAERRLIRPLPPTWLAREEFHEADLFEPGGLAETRWGEQTYALPFGSTVFVVVYDRVLFERFHLDPPSTWSQYQDLANFFGSRTLLSENGAVEPLAVGWAGKTLLARAAAYARHRDYYSTLFDKETMAPQITSPPFARALEELVAAAKSNPSLSLAATPSGARRAVFDGHCAFALTWLTATDSFPEPPPAAGDVDPENSPPALRPPPDAFSVAELPGSTEIYNPKDKAWQTLKPPNEIQHSASSSPMVTPNEWLSISRSGVRSPAPSSVPLLSISGRLGSVTKGAESGEAAFRLLAWLSGDEWGPQICSASPATTLFRRAQLSRPERWVEPQVSRAVAKEYAAVVVRSLSRPLWLECLRIPGQADYMAALDDAVRAAVEGKQSPAEALAHAAGRWSEITTRLGLDSQRAAYSRSLGLEP